MEWVETTGRTIEEAKELALDQLGVDASEAEFELIEEPKSGLFGRTRGNARVRARVVPLTPQPKAERRRRGKKTDSGSGSAGSGSGGTGNGTTGGRSAPGSEDSEPGVKDSSSGAGSSGSSRRKGTTGSGAARNNTEQTVRDTMEMAEQQQVLEAFLTDLAGAFGLSASASSEVDDNQLTVNLSGDDLGLLVGPRLATLDAIQEIARNTLQRQAAGREYAKVVVDVEHIRQRRREALSDFVADAAHQVLDEDVEVVFEVMSSVDRKQVHDVASEIEGVSTSSVGEDPRRRVVLRRG